MSPLNEDIAHMENLEHYQKKREEIFNEVNSIRKGVYESVEEYIKNASKQENSFESMRLSGKEIEFDPQEMQKDLDIEGIEERSGSGFEEILEN